MKNILALLLLSFNFCNLTYASPRHAAITFVNGDSVYDFGRIAKGDKVWYEFEIRNTGDTPLTITNIKSETGILKFEWPKKAVKPNKKALVYVTCSPIEQTEIGSFNTIVFITSNATPQPYGFMHISGAVTPKEETPAVKARKPENQVELRQTPEEINPNR